MILKELDPFSGQSQDDLDARIPAERMVYYLRRHFRYSDEVDVLHGLRLRCGRSFARIDHLLVHAHGLVVVQRHDLGGHLRIGSDGRWVQCAPEGEEPLPSPITHAYIQALLLKDYLDRHVRQRGFFDSLTLDTLVVLPDDCEIEWPSDEALDEVCLRENVFERICRLMEQSIGRGAGLLQASERRTMGRFLCRAHVPLARPGIP